MSLQRSNRTKATDDLRPHPYPIVSSPARILANSFKMFAVVDALEELPGGDAEDILTRMREGKWS